MTIPKKWWILGPVLWVGVLALLMAVCIFLVPRPLTLEERMAAAKEQMRELRAKLGPLGGSASEADPDEAVARFRQRIADIQAMKDVAEMIKAYKSESDGVFLIELGARMGATRDPRVVEPLRSSLGEKQYTVPVFLGGLAYRGTEGDALCAEACSRMNDEQRRSAKVDLEVTYSSESDFQTLVANGGFAKTDAVIPFEKKSR